jgi:gluconolactonase
MTTNIAFGGDGNKILFIRESRTGSIVSVRLPTASRTMFSHA